MYYTKAVIVEDDKFYAEIIQKNLERHKIQTKVVYNFEDAESIVESGETVDIFILDYHIGLKKNGLDLCKKVKSTRIVPVIILTANSDVDNIVCCLNAGADEYIIKPYKTIEFLARVDVALRNYKTLSGVKTERLQANYRGLHINSIEKKGFYKNLEISFTEKEAHLAEILVTNAEREVSRETLYGLIYGNVVGIESRKLDVLVGRLKKKLNNLSARFTIISIRAYGYMFIKKNNGKLLNEYTF